MIPVDNMNRKGFGYSWSGLGQFYVKCKLDRTARTMEFYIPKPFEHHYS